MGMMWLKFRIFKYHTYANTLSKWGKIFFK